MLLTTTFLIRITYLLAATFGTNRYLDCLSSLDRFETPQLTALTLTLLRAHMPEECVLSIMAITALVDAIDHPQFDPVLKRQLAAMFKRSLVPVVVEGSTGGFAVTVGQGAVRWVFRIWTFASHVAGGGDLGLDGCRTRVVEEDAIGTYRWYRRW